MTALVQALSRLSTPANTEAETPKVVAIFCGTGFLVSLLLAIYGFDLGPELF